MTLELPAEVERQIRALVESGRFSSPEDVVENAVARVVENDVLGGYKPGELRALVQEGIAAADRGDTVSIEEARLQILGSLRTVAAS